MNLDHTTLMVAEYDAVAYAHLAHNLGRGYSCGNPGMGGPMQGVCMQDDYFSGDGSSYPSYDGYYDEPMGTPGDRFDGRRSREQTLVRVRNLNPGQEQEEFMRSLSAEMGNITVGNRGGYDAAMGAPHPVNAQRQQMMMRGGPIQTLGHHHYHHISHRLSHHNPGAEMASYGMPQQQQGLPPMSSGYAMDDVAYLQQQLAANVAISPEHGEPSHGQHRRNSSGSRHMHEGSSSVRQMATGAMTGDVQMHHECAGYQAMAKHHLCDVKVEVPHQHLAGCHQHSHHHTPCPHPLGPGSHARISADQHERSISPDSPHLHSPGGRSESKPPLMPVVPAGTRQSARRGRGAPENLNCSGGSSPTGMALPPHLRRRLQRNSSSPSPSSPTSPCWRSPIINGQRGHEPFPLDIDLCMGKEELELLALQNNGDESDEAKMARRKVQNRLAQRRRRKRNSMSDLSTFGGSSSPWVRFGTEEEAVVQYSEEHVMALIEVVDPALARRRRRSTDFVSEEERLDWRRAQNRQAKRRYRERRRSESTVQGGPGDGGGASMEFLQQLKAMHRPTKGVRGVEHVEAQARAL